MSDNFSKKIMIFCIIVLLVISVIIPNITAYQNQKNNIDEDNSEIRVLISGMDSIRNLPIRITEQQATELEYIFHMMKIRLSKIQTYEDTITVYNEVIELLNAAGLLPRDISVEEAKDIVTVEHQNSINCNGIFIDNNSNINCLISGSTSNTMFGGLRVRFWLPFRILFRWEVTYAFWELIPSDLFPLLSEFYDLLFDLIYYRWFFAIALNQINPVSIERMIYLGQDFIWDTKPAKGWIHTTGLNGIKNWNGSFYGDLPFPYLSLLSECPGVLGFNGIQIIKDESSHYYIGHARWVKIREV